MLLRSSPRGAYPYFCSPFIAQDYYPFGMLMPGRIYTASDQKYDYGFNGEYRDDDVKGDGVQYDYGFRIYDTRIAKFLSVDPLTASFPWYTPYQFAGNKPIRFVDLDGLEEADAQQLRDAEQYFQKTKLKQSTIFENISPSLINSQVKARFIGRGKAINQGEFFLCGPAAACHIAASHDPETYVRTIFELYTNGFANGNSIEGNEAIYSAKPDADGNIDGIPAVDWMLMNSLRLSENVSSSYDPHTFDDFSKQTFVHEFVDLLVRLNSDVSITSSGSVGNVEWAKSTLAPWISEGKRAVLFIDSRQYSGGSYENTQSRLVSRYYGRHFIVLKGFEILDSGKVNVQYWDKGRGQVKSKVFNSYEDFDKATMNYWLIKNNQSCE